MTSQVVVDQAKGFLRAQLGVSIDDAFRLLRAYARAHDVHLSKLARQLISNPASRADIVASMSALAVEQRPS